MPNGCCPHLARPSPTPPCEPVGGTFSFRGRGQQAAGGGRAWSVASHSGANGRGAPGKQSPAGPSACVDARCAAGKAAGGFSGWGCCLLLIRWSTVAGGAPSVGGLTLRFSVRSPPVPANGSAAVFLRSYFWSGARRCRPAIGGHSFLSRGMISPRVPFQPLEMPPSQILSQVTVK